MRDYSNINNNNNHNSNNTNRSANDNGSDDDDNKHNKTGSPGQTFHEASACYKHARCVP